VNIKHLAVGDTPGTYTVDKNLTCEAILEIARKLSVTKLVRGEIMESPMDVKALISAQLMNVEREVFSVLFMTSRYQIIAFEKMFYGTVNEARVYPREVVKRALELNASTVILAHNHPSGTALPSKADKDLTKTLKSALEVFDITIIDHFICTPTITSSFAELDLL